MAEWCPRLAIERARTVTLHLPPARRSSIPTKIVQHAVGTVLNQIYEEDFLGFSYGFRPGRGTHDALDALWVGIIRKKVNWVLDADIRDCYGSFSHECRHPAPKDRKSTRLNSSHGYISYAVFCLKKKTARH